MEFVFISHVRTFEYYLVNYFVFVSSANSANNHFGDSFFPIWYSHLYFLKNDLIITIKTHYNFYLFIYFTSVMMTCAYSFAFSEKSSIILARVS